VGTEKADPGDPAAGAVAKQLPRPVARMKVAYSMKSKPELGEKSAELWAVAMDEAGTRWVFTDF
jgi:hypothetical protein